MAHDRLHELRALREERLEGRAAAKPVAELSEEDRSALAEHPRRTLNRLLFPGPDAVIVPQQRRNQER